MRVIMGIYWAAVDNTAKEYFESPEDFSIKSPGIFHPHNPFGCMVVMKNMLGGNFEIENDGQWDCYYSKGYKDITKEVYQEFLKWFPWAKEYYEGLE